MDILLSWKQTRVGINKTKLSRGFGGHPRDFKKLEARVKCFKCKQIGHFSRNCPKRSAKSPPKAGSSSSSKVSFVNMVKDEYSQDFDSACAAVVNSWKSKPRDFWHCRGNEVIREHVVARSSMFSPARSGCPVDLSELSTARKTIMHCNGTEPKVDFTANWKVAIEAHKATPQSWTGQTIFYKLQSHGDVTTSDDGEEQVEGEALWSQICEIHDAFQEEVTDALCLGDDSDQEDDLETTCALVHEAGYGVVDTGCGKGIIGENTLTRHIQELNKFGKKCENLEARPHTFRYGNGSSDVSTRKVQFPVFLSGKELRMRVHVVPGDVPLLISKQFLKGLGAQLDLQLNMIHFNKAGVSVKLVEKRDGSYQLNLLDKEPPAPQETPEVDILGVLHETAEDKHNVAYTVKNDQSDTDTDESDDGGVQGVMPASVRKELKTNLTEVLQARPQDHLTMIELFSPGRFAEKADQFGFVSRGAFDLSSGWDWTDPVQRKKAEVTVEMVAPDVLCMSPPCGPLSILQQMIPESKRVHPERHAQEVREAKSMVRWCARLAMRQVQQGRDFVFESSDRSGAWQDEVLAAVERRLGCSSVAVPACAVGLRDKSSRKLFSQRWRFLTSSPALRASLQRLHCSGDHDHQTVEGSSGGVARSIQSQVYPSRLIHIILGALAEQEQQQSLCAAISQAVVQPLATGEKRRRLELAVKKLHVNLGHASIEDMTRILRHHGAQADVLETVKAFSCDTCLARKKPKAVKDSTVRKDLAPLRYIGIDVKQLPGFKKDEPIKALNVVCRSSGLQHMYPFRETENSALIGRLYRQWTRSFGRPRYVKFDASRCNLGQHFMDMLERDGTTPLDIPGEAHEQLGDVEVQGQHFETMLKHVVAECDPQDFLQWTDCVDSTIEAKNMLMRRGGYSPNQLVFGRDPEIPGDDILADNPNPISNGAIVEDAIADFSHGTRLAARQGVLQALDQRAARVALNSRPRPRREFRTGDEVAVWRRGRGIKKSAARWRGPGIVAGEAGGNFWVSMPGSFIKCSPEQLRLRTHEEKEVDRFLVRDLRAAAASLYPEVGASNRHQKNFLDITHEDIPPGDISVFEHVGIPDCTTNAPTDVGNQVPVTPVPPMSGASAPSVQSVPSSGQTITSSLHERVQQMTPAEQQQWEQSARNADRLDGHALRRASQPAVAEPDPKRSRTDQQVGGQVFPPSLPQPPHQMQPQTIPPTHQIRPHLHPPLHPMVPTVSSSNDSSSSSSTLGSAVSHAACVRDCGAAAVCMSAAEPETDHWVFAASLFSDESCVLLAGGRKEINLRDEKWKSTSNQKLLHQGLNKEYDNVVHQKAAIRPLSMEQSRRIRQQQPHRIVPSKLVLTTKLEDSGEEVVKARWTARGDKDPDLFSLVREGKTQAPTISSNGRYTVLQVCASCEFEMQLGDVTGAFLEADALERSAGPLYMSSPSNCAFPDISPEILYEIVRPLYGLNDSPQQWFIKFSKTATRLGWKTSRLDHCVFFLWGEQDGQTMLVGVMGVHVDDVLIGGRGPVFERAVEALRKEFPFRKWKIGEGAGAFCGAMLKQDPKTFAISVSQQEFAEKLEKPKLRIRENALMKVNKQEASSLKSVLGGALWLAKETHQDLSVQVSMGQQLLPEPTLGEARTVANVVRRAKEYKDLSWNILPIPLSQLKLCVHSDAAFANAKRQGTQAGYIIGATDRKLQQGEAAPWGPATWKSYRLKRVVGSTFAGETQVLMDALGHVEWLACHLAEACDPKFSLKNREEHLSRFGVQAIIDCKSVYDHLQNYASPGTVSDKRVAIDLVIIRETLQRLGACVRWAPTWIQLADALTKENAEAMDILRAAMVTNQYHLHEESVMMQAAAAQRHKRLQGQKVINKNNQDNHHADDQNCSAMTNHDKLSDKDKDQDVVQEEKSQVSAAYLITSRGELMVKVSVGRLSENDVRALFEMMISETCSDSDDFLKKCVQSKSKCCIKLAAEKVNVKAFKGDSKDITFTYTKTTQMIAIQCGAVYMDKTEKTLEQVLKVYGRMVNDGVIEPIPDGANAWGIAMKRLWEEGVISQYLESGKTEEEWFEIENKEISQAFAPKEEEYVAAVSEIAAEGTRKLYHFPQWQKKFVQLMVREMGAEPEILHSLVDSEQAQDQQDEWEAMTEKAGASAKGKAEPKRGFGGYRPRSP